MRNVQRLAQAKIAGSNPVPLSIALQTGAIYLLMTAGKDRQHGTVAQLAVRRGNRFGVWRFESARFRHWQLGVAKVIFFPFLLIQADSRQRPPAGFWPCSRRLYGALM